MSSLDVSGNNGSIYSYVNNALSEIKKKSHTQQVCIGSSSGFAKIGKTAALVVGGTLIAMQCAVQQGVISIDWKKLNKAKDEAIANSPWVDKRVSKMLKENRVFFGSFGGGFLIGIYFS